jgi:hypothetical protein
LRDGVGPPAVGALNVVHALDGEQQQAVGAPAAGPEEEHRVVVAQADEVEARLV